MLAAGSQTHITTGCSTLLTVSAASALHALQAAKQLWSLHCHICLNVRKAQHCAVPAADSRAQIIWLGRDSCRTERELTEQQAACKEVKALLLASSHWHLNPSRWQAPADAGSTVLLFVCKLTPTDPAWANSSWLAGECRRHFLVARDGPLGSTCFSYPSSLQTSRDSMWLPLRHSCAALN